MGGGKKPELYSAFGKIDPRLKKLFRVEPSVKRAPAPQVVLPVEVATPKSRISDPGCHDTGELFRD